MDEQTIEMKANEAYTRRDLLLDAWVYEIQEAIDAAMIGVSNDLDRERLDDDFLLLQSGMSLFISKFSQAYNKRLQEVERELDQLKALQKSKKEANQKAK